MVKDRVRPPQGRGVEGRGIALGLAILVNLLFVAVLVFSVTWRNEPPAAITAELYAPPVKSPAPKSEPKPEPPKPEPEPPKPEPPKPEPPKPEPPKPAPEPDVQALREAEIALKAKLAEEKKRRDDLARAKVETEKKQREAEAKEKDERRRADKQKEEKLLAETRARQQRETEAMREQAEREAKLRAENEARVRAQNEAKARATAEAQARLNAENAARAKAESDWIRSIQNKVRGNVILPPDIPGNPEAIFDVVQLPTGEILDAKLRKSSGVPAYDDAVLRAIYKSSPLPRPPRPELFQRALALRFRPVD